MFVLLNSHDARDLRELAVLGFWVAARARGATDGESVEELRHGRCCHVLRSSHSQVMYLTFHGIRSIS